MSIPDEKEQKRMKSLLHELDQLPDGWKIFIEPERNRIGYVKDGKKTFDHPRLGPLPKGWVIRLFTSTETRVYEPRYQDTTTKKTYDEDPRTRAEVLKAHEETVRRHHTGEHASLFSVAGSVRRTQKGEDLDDLQRAPIAQTDISHHYEYLHVIDGGEGGLGGMNGGVFVSRLKHVGGLYVEKRFKPEIYELAVNEILLLRRLKHSALNFYIAAYIIRHEKRCAVWLEFCDRGSLKDLIKAYASKRRVTRDGEYKPHMPEKWLWHCFIGLADALTYLRTGKRFIGKNIKDPNERYPSWVPVLHRDIKPDNVLLKSRTHSAERNYFYAVLSDFGLAVEEYPEGDWRNNKMHMAGVICGTPLWCAPELCGNPWQLRDDNYFADRLRHTEKTDLWALGTTIYNMAECNENAHVHEERKYDCPDRRRYDWVFSRVCLRSDREIKTYYSDELRDCIKSAAAWDPRDRPTPMELTIKMAGYVEQLYGHNHKPTPSEQLPDWATRKHDHHSRDVILPDQLFK